MKRIEVFISEGDADRRLGTLEFYELRGKYGLVEIKLGGGSLLDDGTRSLNGLEKLTGTSKSGRMGLRWV